MSNLKKVIEAFPEAEPKFNYAKGILDYPLKHESQLQEYISYLKEIFGDKKFYVKISDEEEMKTLQQIKLIHSLFRLLDMANCMNERLDDEEKIKEYFKIKCGLISKYGYFDENNRLNYTKELDIAKKHKNWYPITKSLSNVSKKALKELIDYVLNYCDKQNQYGNLGNQEKKYIEIREQLENNSIERFRR